MFFFSASMFTVQWRLGLVCLVCVFRPFGETARSCSVGDGEVNRYYHMPEDPCEGRTASVEQCTDNGTLNSEGATQLFIFCPSWREVFR